MSFMMIPFKLNLVLFVWVCLLAVPSIHAAKVRVTPCAKPNQYPVRIHEAHSFPSPPGAGRDVEFTIKAFTDINLPPSRRNGRVDVHTILEIEAPRNLAEIPVGEDGPRSLCQFRPRNHCFVSHRNWFSFKISETMPPGAPERMVLQLKMEDDHGNELACYRLQFSTVASARLPRF